MAFTSDNDLVERVKAGVDIVDVAQGYFPLTRRGDKFWALCPFHKEKTASFTVQPTRQIFKCFGCQKGGDVFTLVMELDRLTFREAIKVLARRAGITVTENLNPRVAAAEEKRLKLFTIVKHAEEFYRDTLKDSAGAMARDYLKRRGFSAESIDAFGIGFAPNEWRALHSHLAERGHAEADVIRAGVIKRNDTSGRPFDLLRRRVVIPIRDARGRSVAFGGRILEDSGPDAGPKYLNTPETELFSKRQVLFGFDRAREDAGRRGEFIVVEGYLDAIAAHQHGVRNVVATLGTALTPDHAQLLRRYAQRVVLLFDPDEGGQRGADRGAAVLLREGFEVVVANLPDGLDPDEFLERFGLAAFEQFLADGSEDLVRYLVRRARDKERAEGGSEAASARAVREVLQFLGQIQDPLLAERLVRHLSEDFRLDEALVRRIAAEIVRAAPAKAAEPGSALPPPRALPGAELDEVFALHGVLTCAKLAGRAVVELAETDFRDPARRRVFAAAVLLVREGASVAPAQLTEVLSEDPEARFALNQAVSVDVPTGDDPARAVDRLVGRRQALEYRKLREDVRRSGVLRSEDDAEIERRLQELSRFQTERYQRLKEPKRVRNEDGAAPEGSAGA